MKAIIINLIITFIFITQQCNAVEPGGGLDALLFEQLGKSLDGLFFTDNPVQDDGEKGPYEEGNYRFVGAPRKCINLVNGKVNAGNHTGEHLLKVMRQIKKSGIDGMCYWEDDILVYDSYPDVESISVEEGESYPWDLEFKGSNHITINSASGTMKGCMSQGKAAGVLAITGIIIGGVIALL